MTDELLSHEIKTRVSSAMKEGILELARVQFPHQRRAESLVVRQAIYEYLQRHPIKSSARHRSSSGHSNPPHPER